MTAGEVTARRRVAVSVAGEMRDAGTFRLFLHPGEHLREELETIAEFWLNLQGLYELRLAQQESGKAIDRLPTLKRRSPISA